LASPRKAARFKIRRPIFVWVEALELLRFFQWRNSKMPQIDPTKKHRIQVRIIDAETGTERASSDLVIGGWCCCCCNYTYIPEPDPNGPIRSQQ
jgi:hypothetical protein